jgi:hypothetical protein
MLHRFFNDDGISERFGICLLVALTLLMHPLSERAFL